MIPAIDHLLSRAQEVHKESDGIMDSFLYPLVLVRDSHDKLTALLRDIEQEYVELKADILVLSSKIAYLEKERETLLSSIASKDKSLHYSQSKANEYRTKNAKLRAQLKKLRYDHDQP